MSAASAVELTDATFPYGRDPALLGVSLVLPAGASIALLGRNASGKSTLLRGLVGLLTPGAGRVRVLGRPPVAARSRVAYLGQRPPAGRMPPMTVRDAVRIGRFARLGWFHRFGAEDRDAVDDAMARLGITSIAARSLHELSGGQRQRVELAQVLAQQADLLLLDEPFGGLDLPTKQRLLAVLSDERARGATVIVATHQLTVAFRCDLAVLLDRRVVAFGPPAEACKEANLVRAFGLLDDLAVQTAGLLLPDHTATRPLLDTDEGAS